MRAHEWFDLLDEDFDQAVFRQTPEQNRFDQQVGNDLIVDGDMFEMIGMSRLRAFRKAPAPIKPCLDTIRQDGA